MDNLKTLAIHVEVCNISSTTRWLVSRRVWRYQRDNQNP